MSTIRLYSYFRSSASYRVRIALNLKGLAADTIPVNLLKGEQQGDLYRQLNPQMRVPTLIKGEHVLTQSMAIMEYLEEAYPEPPLLPQSPFDRAYVRALAQAVSCDISPLNNLGPLIYLEREFHATDEQKSKWYHHWVHTGFTAIEKTLATSPHAGRFCYGATPTMADCCLIPQVFNARRYHVNLSDYPIITRIDSACNDLLPFLAAHPSNQPDAA